MKPPTLTVNEHITLRPYTEDDTERLAVIGNHETIADHVGESFPHPYTKQEAEKWLKICKEVYEDENNKKRLWAIEINGELAGGLGLEKFKSDHCMIGYWLGEDYWGQGHMTRIAKRALDYALDDLGLVKVWADVYAHNPASARVLEKIGMHKEATFEKHYKRPSGEYVNVWRYCIIR